MRATLREFGGPIDPTGRRAHTADTNSMSREMAEEFARLAAEAQAHPPLPDTTAGRARDMMTYSIAIEDDGPPVVLKQSDATRTQAFIDLQAWIKRNGRRS